MDERSKGANNGKKPDKIIICIIQTTREHVLYCTVLYDGTLGMVFFFLHSWLPLYSSDYATAAGARCISQYKNSINNNRRNKDPGFVPVQRRAANPVPLRSTGSCWRLVQWAAGDAGMQEMRRNTRNQPRRKDTHYRFTAICSKFYWRTQRGPGETKWLQKRETTDTTGHMEGRNHEKLWGIWGDYRRGSDIRCNGTKSMDWSIELTNNYHITRIVTVMRVESIGTQSPLNPE